MVYSIEVTFRQSRCPENLRTVNATGVFQSRALDWWTAERNRRGNDAAYGLAWEELKELMMKEFCPPTKSRSWKTSSRTSSKLEVTTLVSPPDSSS
ncbi:hypothetical protein HanIR_Chr16g0816231 [Helianthus annuus]|nr:hypothetical protein HanIR_Chr16g0816231 [Helianthus annuus]